jgi:hypothetical protein
VRKNNTQTRAKQTMGERTWEDNRKRTDFIYLFIQKKVTTGFVKKNIYLNLNKYISD